MARIAGVNIPQNKLVHIGLTYIYGIGNKFSSQICEHESNLSFLIKQIVPVDIVIVEGFKVSSHKKVEVVNSKSEKKPLYETDKSICGLIFSKHKIQNISLPQFERDDIRQICDFIETTIGIE